MIMQVPPALRLAAALGACCLGLMSTQAHSVECGAPSIDPRVEKGAFFWKQCGTENWTLQVTAGGDSAGAVYRGALDTDGRFSSMVGAKLEPNDQIIQSASGSRVSLELSVWNAAIDLVRFSAPAGKRICFQADRGSAGPVYVGRTKQRASGYFTLDTLESCAGGSSGSSPLNFVFVLTDDQRWDTLWSMPNVLDKLASRGVVFENAFVTTPLCGPSRASMLSGGFRAENTGVLVTSPIVGGAATFQRRDMDSLATTLQQAGYKTMYAGGKYLNGYKAPYIPPGWTSFVNNVQGPSAGLWNKFNVVSGSSGARSSNGKVTGSQTYVTNYHRDRVLGFLDSVGNQPFFVFFSVFAPHAPAIPEARDKDLFTGYVYRDRAHGEKDLSDKPTWVRVPSRSKGVKSGSDEFHRNQLRSLRSVDRAVGAIVDKIDAKGLLDRTVFVYASDNGFLWGEHGLYTKGMAYEESIRVPLVLVVPGMKPGTRSAMVAADLDIAATILDLAGVSRAGDGMSLMPLVDNPDAPWRQSLVFQHWGNFESAFGTWSALRTARYKYVENSRGETELYDLATDPYEEDSLHAHPGFAALKRQLADQLTARRGLGITTWRAPGGRLGRAYNYRLGAWAADQVSSWTIDAGTLPPGLSLDAKTGVISGTPTKAGTYQVRIRATDRAIATHARTNQRDIRPMTGLHTIAIAP